VVRWIRSGRALVGTGVVAAATAVVLLGGAGTGPATGQVPPVLLSAPTASDPRATFVEGNAVTCDDVGFDTATQVGADGNAAASDVNVSGTVTTNAGTVQPGQGEELNVTITGTGVVIDAVVVKGGNGYNLYTNPAVLPPALAPPQHYIAPFNGGGNVPALSHWFVCYHLSEPDPPGSLVVLKRVIAPPGIPVDPIPTSISADVTCSDGTTATVTFTRGGGRSANNVIDGLEPGTTCTVVEDESSLPPGTDVIYEPEGANTPPGVTIVEGEAVVVEITNDLSGIEVVTAAIALSKTVVPAPGVTTPASFTARVICEDGTNADVTLPGAGGPGTPELEVVPRTLCVMGELPGSVPEGWTVSYSVNGATPPTNPPIFLVIDDTTIEAAITNVASGTTTTTTTATTSTTVATTTTTIGSGVEGTGVAADPDLARTGTGTLTTLVVGLAAITVGLAMTASSKRRYPGHHARN
jgi:hypothetical protein